VIEMEDYFRELIRGIDSSLLEEWEKLRNPEFIAAEVEGKPARPASFDLTRDRPAFTRLVRTAILGFLQDAAARDWEAARLRLAPDGDAPDETAQLAGARRIEKEFVAYFEARGRFRLDPAGRSALNTHLDETSDENGPIWRISQVLVDPDGQNDWEARFEIPLGECRARNQVVLGFLGVNPVGSA
jgi:hypothetical protein